MFVIQHTCIMKLFLNVNKNMELRTLSGITDEVTFYSNEVVTLSDASHPNEQEEEEALNKLPVVQSVLLVKNLRKEWSTS